MRIVSRISARDYVIHAVGPYWSDGSHGEVELLKRTYFSCFKLIDEYYIKTVSFPNISTGIYKFPKELAAKIVLDVITHCLHKNNKIEMINLVCFDRINYGLYLNQISK
ncbi:TPA: macro domain-containing protein [Kluyvera georgiana]